MSQHWRSTGRRQSSSAPPQPPALAGGDGTLQLSSYCNACDKHGHTPENCPHFLGRARGQLDWQAEPHDDAQQPSETEIADNLASGEQPDVIIRGTVVKMSGQGLQCWYRTVLRGLQDLGHESRPRDLAALQERLVRFLRSEEAAHVRDSSSGALLSEVLRRDRRSLVQFAQAVQRGGGGGMGGAELVAVLVHLYAVDVHVHLRIPGKPGDFKRIGA